MGSRYIKYGENPYLGTLLKDVCLAASFSKRVRTGRNIYSACDTSGCGTRFPHYAEYAVTTVTNRRASTILKPPSDSKHTLYIPRSDRWADLRDWRQEGNSVWSIIRHPGRFSTRGRRLVSPWKFAWSMKKFANRISKPPLKITENGERAKGLRSRNFSQLTKLQ